MNARNKRISVSAADAAEKFPPARVIRIAEFRAGLRSFLRHHEQACRNWDLTPQRHLLLLALKGAPDGSERLSFTDLAEKLQLSRNTVTELCARAEEVGLIAREPSVDDQRVVYLRATAEGERRFYGVLNESDEFRGELMKTFDELADTLRKTTRRPRGAKR
jgi:DNA-binding MarR family transcriptional regulator